ncbi:hypothetical protein DFH07DRAFT_1031857 [Mycena maculata]|uniref:Uncharacterized protein n=1 Tax=Mycena maculata TaxID=230809 RepID=A0AAD7J0L7_9AGAR|nr:hypothetical protein DFH07DRAFT_1031857 [Mycena maculata]
MHMLLPSGGMRLIYKVLVSYQVDLLRTVRDRVEFWQIDPLIADGFWLTGRLLGNLLVSAAHGINFVDHAVPAVPIQIPIAALRAVGLPIPTILLVLGYPSNPLRHRRYSSPEAAVADCLLFIEWLEHNLCWLAECFRRIILRRSEGFDTVWDFGTVLGMGKDEFFDSVADSRAEAGLDELDILLSTIEEAPLSYNELDFDVAELIRPWYTHLGVVACRTSSLLSPGTSRTHARILPSGGMLSGTSPDGSRRTADSLDLPQRGAQYPRRAQDAPRVRRLGQLEADFQRKNLRRRCLHFLLLHPSAREARDAGTHLWMQTSYAFIALQTTSSPARRFWQFLTDEERFWRALVLRVQRVYGVPLPAAGALLGGAEPAPRNIDPKKNRLYEPRTRSRRMRGTWRIGSLFWRTSETAGENLGGVRGAGGKGDKNDKEVGVHKEGSEGKVMKAQTGGGVQIAGEGKRGRRQTGTATLGHCHAGAWSASSTIWCCYMRLRFRPMVIHNGYARQADQFGSRKHASWVSVRCSVSLCISSP